MTAETAQFTRTFDAQAYADSMPHARMQLAPSIEAFQDPRLALIAKLSRISVEIDRVEPEIAPVAPTLQYRAGQLAVDVVVTSANSFAAETESTVQELLGAAPSPKVVYLASAVGRTAVAV